MQVDALERIAELLSTTELDDGVGLHHPNRGSSTQSDTDVQDTTDATDPTDGERTDTGESERAGHTRVKTRKPQGVKPSSSSDADSVASDRPKANPVSAPHSPLLALSRGSRNTQKRPRLLRPPSNSSTDHAFSQTLGRSVAGAVRGLMEQAQLMVAADRLRPLPASNPHSPLLRCSLFLVDHQRGELYAQTRDRFQIRFPVSVGIAGAVARSGKAVKVNNVSEDSRWNPGWLLYRRAST